MKEKFDISCVFIDYLQLMSSGSRSESRQVEVSEISRGIKAMARELDVPVVCLSQLNRAAEQREGHRPRMSDLRESGSIEQDADVIMMLHREEYYHQGDAEWSETNLDKVGMAELIFAKQRNGPTGVIKLIWDQNSTCFRSFSPLAAPSGVEYRSFEPRGARFDGGPDDLPT
jgi:replicative DNA helicase